MAEPKKLEKSVDLLERTYDSNFRRVLIKEACQKYQSVAKLQDHDRVSGEINASKLISNADKNVQLQFLL